MDYQPSKTFASQLDELDSLRDLKQQFHFPNFNGEGDAIYLVGNSLGLQPRSAAGYITRELEDWARLGVEGHLHAEHPWLPYHELVTEPLARVVGAMPLETVAMNSLTVNLHLMMVSFYKPSGERQKIVIEKGSFPSDRYAVVSQIEAHSAWSGIDAKDALIELTPREGESTLRTSDIIDTIERHGSEIALVMLGGVNYYTGQAFDMQAITEAGHRVGARVGFDLAHAAGNLHLKLHDWNVDFAVWCSYKYLNSGPGGIAGAFVHERHSRDTALPRFAGWWGHNKQTRFLMGPDFDPLPGAEGWQLSNPPIFQLAALRASLEIFDKAGMERLREKSVQLTGYLEYLLKQIEGDRISVITPTDAEQRGCQLSIRVRDAGRELFDALTSRGVVVDWREPDVIRAAPVPLYNSFTDVFRFAEILKETLAE